MRTNIDMKIKRSDNTIWRVVDGEVVILLPDGHMLYALKGCGSRVWELIEEEKSISEIARKICDEYEVEPERASEDITEFINELAEMKLVDISPSEIKEVSR